MKELVCEVRLNRQIAENIYELTLALPEDAGQIKGGQFLNLSTGEKQHLLKRPLGIMKAEDGCVTVCYQVKGGGTKALAAAKEGDKLTALLPLGNGFDIKEEEKNIVVIGGGVGIFPLISVIRSHPEKNFYSYIGFRNTNAACLLEELKQSKQLTITTDDGSFGKKGNAVSAYLDDIKKVKADLIIACGPPVMLKVLKQKLEEKKIKTRCLVSLEERMGCGIGACLVCACKKTDGTNARVCKDGPVFDITEVEL